MYVGQDEGRRLFQFPPSLDFHNNPFIIVQWIVHKQHTGNCMHNTLGHCGNNDFLAPMYRSTIGLRKEDREYTF